MSTVRLTPDELEDMLDRAARRGDKEARRSLGLQDAEAQRDLHELRS